jgi:adenosine deaminase
MKLEYDFTSLVCLLEEEEIREFPVQALEASFPYSTKKLRAL